MAEGLFEKAEKLSKIAKRKDELKVKLEAGGATADEMADMGLEYRLMKDAYKKLLDEINKEEAK